MGALAGTPSAAGALQRVRYSHDAVIDLVIAEPQLTQREIAVKFGYSEGWLSRVFCSDSFQARLAERKKEVVDPVLIHSLEERLKGLASQATDVLSERLATTRSPELATKALDIASKALGFGARQVQTPVQVNNFVVALPPKIVDAKEWAQAHGRTISTEEA